MTRSARLAFWLGPLLFAVSVAASAQEAFTTRSVNVRAGPDTSYPAVAVLGSGTPVEVMGCLDDWSWCDVVFADNRGWVYSPYLSYVYQGSRVPFYSYAPTFGIPIVTFSVGPYWDRYYRGRPWYGRRDFWERRAPVHVRPAGPPPRTTLPSRGFPESRPGDFRGNDRNWNRDGNRPAEGRRPPPGAQGGPAPSGNRGAEARPVAPQRPANTPMQAVERAQGAGRQQAAPPSRGGGEQRVERSSREGGERRGESGERRGGEGRGSEDKR